MWDEADRPTARDLLEITANEIAGIVAGVAGVTAEGVSVDLELLLLPLRHRGSSRARQIGVLAPAHAAVLAGRDPADDPRASSRIAISVRRCETVPTLVAASDSGRVRHGLLVYDGGRA